MTKKKPRQYIYSKCDIPYCHLNLTKRFPIRVRWPNGKERVLLVCGFHSDCWGGNPEALARHLKKGWNPHEAVRSPG